MKWLVPVIIALLIIWLGVRYYLLSQPSQVTMIDFNHINLPKTPNYCLVTNKVYSVAANQLKEKIIYITSQTPRTKRLEHNHNQMIFVTHSLLFGFPDVAYIQITPLNEGRSELSIYSHALYGYSDLGMNRKKVDAWLKQLKELSAN